MIPSITWANPPGFWLIALMLVLFVTVIYRAYTRYSTARALDKHTRMLKNFSSRAVIIKACLSCLGLAGILCALSHPQWGEQKESVRQCARDIIIALDVSQSMLAQDIKPDRLSCAKQAIVRVLDALPADQISLMLFCDKARVYCPLTRDHDLIKMFIETIDHTSICTGQTFLDQPILCAIQECKRCPERKNRLLVLVTDGEDFSGALESLCQKAQQEQLVLCIMGIGTAQGSPIALYDEQNKLTGYVKDKNSHVVISKLNEQALHALAQKTGGVYCTIHDTNPNICSIAHAIQTREKELHEQKELCARQEQYPWFLAVSLLCFVSEWIL